MSDRRQRDSKNSLQAKILAEVKGNEAAYVYNRLLISANIRDRMDSLKIQKAELARTLNRRPSEVTKWLSGTHNFTVKLLTIIASALDTTYSELSSEMEE